MNTLNFPYRKVKQMLLALLFSGILIVSLYGCGRSSNHELRDATDELMRQNPDSAVMLFDLLGGDALIITEDDNRLNMIVHYCLARRYYSSEDYAASVVACLEAEKLALSFGDDFYLGAIYGLLAKTYSTIYAYQDAQRYAQLAFEHYQLAGNRNLLRIAQYNLAQASIETRDYDKSEKILTQLIKESMAEGDTAFAGKCMNERAHVLFKMHKYPESKIQMIVLRDTYNCPLNTTSCGHLAEIYDLELKPDSAQIYLERGQNAITSSRDKEAINSARLSIAVYNGDLQSALFCQLSMAEMQNQALDNVWKQAVSTRQRDFYNQQTLIAREQARTSRVYMLLATIALIAVALIFGVYYLYNRNRRLKYEINLATARKQVEEQRLQGEEQLLENTHKITRLQQSIEAISADNEKLRAELEAEKLKLLEANGQIEDYLQHQRELNAHIEGSDIYHALRTRLHNHSGGVTSEEWGHIESIIDEVSPYFKTRLYGLGKISYLEYRLCLLIRMKFSPTECATLLNKEKSSVSSARSRFCNKIGLQLSVLDELIRSL